MNPKKPKQFIKPTAESLGLDESLVDDVVGFYWSSVRKALADLESPSVTVANLGTFRVRYNNIPKTELKYQNYLASLELDAMTYNQHTIQNISKYKLKKLEEIKLQMDEEFARREEVRQKRKEYVTNKAMEGEG